MKNIEIEISYVEKCSQRWKIQNPNEVFGEMKQLTTLLASETCDLFLDPAIRTKQFGRLTDAAKIIKIMEKLRKFYDFLLIFCVKISRRSWLLY